MEQTMEPPIETIKFLSIKYNENKNLNIIHIDFKLSIILQAHEYVQKFLQIVNLLYRVQVIIQFDYGMQNRETLKDLHTPLSRFQYEIIICGCYRQRAVIFIIQSETNTSLSVIIQVNIFLLSFGSNWKGGNIHTLIMKYVSVCGDISNKSSNYSQWIPFTDNQNPKNKQ
ncbi:hypothetical protein RFI_35538 [Reticulomyxa filosa]|uniref:Uncharacterized protein n=1 Tax=Reticulomyxa filosa TaxID=46433 RepID=X6LKN7_RETFI|nr:hypothetical protein RFI_35538 [Reticulomyxa filosa]|eukprot:ETO01901.1 hypothetical protein RFI_35538 [Reticulomyxa filosa]